MDEFSFIASLLSPLAQHPAAMGLRDDAALLDIPAGQSLVITKDALVEGVHFTGEESPDLIARKLLRVNLSDLAAMGAKPYGYFLALMLPEYVDTDWLAGFTQGLAHDQEFFQWSLLGGDTTRTHQHLSLSVTALGTVPVGKALKRSGAKPGDKLYVTGTVGDAAVAFAYRKEAHHGIIQHLMQRYLLPEPRIAVGLALRHFASACIDISDGLAQDASHICENSAAGADIYWPRMPLSTGVSALREETHAFRDLVLAGGDDYELLFTAAPEYDATVRQLSVTLSVPITQIGEITRSTKVRILDAHGGDIILPRKGYRHF